jgi:peptide/nickel transport system substrate-binding protein
MRSDSHKFIGTLGLALAVLVTTCAPSSLSHPDSPQSAVRIPQSPKRLVTAIMAEPPTLYRALIGGAVTQAKEIAFNVVNIGLTVVDEGGVRRPAMAEAVPSLENGLWKLLPDGKMELTWKIRPGAAWHDGTPLSADDLVFTVTVVQDREFPEFRAPAAELIERAAVVDASTLSTTWKRPFIRADYLFYGHSEGFAQPIPKHLLEPAYLDNRDGFRQLPYWSYEYVGLGPYRLKEWAMGSHLLLEANERYVLGHPKIDELEIRFTLDANTVAANILSGAVQATIGTGLSLEQALEVRDQWREGRLAVAYENWLVIYPQFVNPNPPIITDLRFRRALLQAIDRQAMADIIQSGLVPVAHSYVRPDELEYPETERFLVRYEYDPRRAGQVIEELDYVRGADGVFRDASGQRLAIEVRATTSPSIHTKSMFPVADYWQRLGLAVEPLVVPVQRTNDREYRATRPPSR